jgi:hypothetical protein
MHAATEAARLQALVGTRGRSRWTVRHRRLGWRGRDVPVLMPSAWASSAADTGRAWTQVSSYCRAALRAGKGLPWPSEWHRQRRLHLGNPSLLQPFVQPSSHFQGCFGAPRCLSDQRRRVQNRPYESWPGPPQLIWLTFLQAPPSGRFLTQSRQLWTHLFKQFVQPCSRAGKFRRLAVKQLHERLLCAGPPAECRHATDGVL